MATIQELQEGIATAKEFNKPDIAARLAKELARMQAEEAKAKPAAKPAEGVMDQWSEEIKGDPSLGEAAWQGIFNVPGSAWQAAKDIVHPIMHPQETAEGLDVLGQGLAGHANAALAENLPDWLKTGIGFKQRYSEKTPTPEMDIAKKAGGILAHRALHWRETLRDDPVGLLSDVSGILMPAGGALREVGTLARAQRLANIGRGISRAGEALQPSNIVMRPVPAIVRRTPVFGEEASLARMRRRAPTEEEVQRQTTADYAEIARRNIQIDPQTHERMVGDINAEVARPNSYPVPATPQSRGVIAMINENRAQGVAPLQDALTASQRALAQAQETLRASQATGSPSVTRDAAEVSRLQAEVAANLAQARRGPSLPIEDAESARRSALAVSGPGVSRTDRSLAHRVMGSLDRAFESLPDLPLVQQAREYGRRNLLANVIHTIEESPERVAGYESSMRNQIQAYLKRQGHTLTRTERDAFNRIVAREGVQNVMHTLASRIGLLAGVAGGTAGTQNPIIGTAAAIAANQAARRAAESITERQMREALQTVLAGRERQAIHQRRTDWRRAGYQTLGRGGAIAGTYLRPYGSITRPPYEE